MRERDQLWLAFFIRWIGISLLALFVTWQYNNNDPYWHIHVMWVVHTAWAIFWLTQALHVTFLAMIAGIVVWGKREGRK